jgi:predicted DNA-binding protein
MSPEIQEKNVSVKISQKSIEILDDLARQADISRHKLVHDIIELTIEEMEFHRRIGFFQMSILIRNIAQKLIKLPDLNEGKDDQKEKTVPIRLSSSSYDRLDLLAKQVDRSRHYLMKKFIEVGADELDRIHNKKVIVTHGIMMRKLKLKLNALCTEGEKAFESSLSAIE